MISFQTTKLRKKAVWGSVFLIDIALLIECRSNKNTLFRGDTIILYKLPYQQKTKESQTSVYRIVSILQTFFLWFYSKKSYKSILSI